MRRVIVLRSALRALVVAGLVVGALAWPSPVATAAHRVPARVPILFVHGFDGSARDWDAMETRFRAAGYPSEALASFTYDRNVSNVDVARRIAREVTALLARTHAAKVDLVSHSMGAISSRYYLERLGGTARVAAWVSLAGINSGTVWAYGCYVLEQCREMVPTSGLLGDLNARFSATGPTRYGAWWSPCDDAVVPRANARLDGAHNTETACVSHSDFKTDATVFTEVLRFLHA